MPTVKEYVRSLLEELPDDISWKQLRHEIWVMEKIEQANGEIERGETIPHAQVMKEIDEWLLKSSGRNQRKKTSKKSSRSLKKIPLLTLNESPAKYGKK